MTAKNYHCYSKESPFFSQAEGALRAHFLPNLFAGQPIHRKPQPLHFSHKSNTANPYTANPNPFFPEIGFAVFFSQKPNKKICLVSVKKTQQTHALFLHPMWFSFSIADMRFLCFVHFLCFVGVMCVRWWWCVDDAALMMKGGIDFGKNFDCEEARWCWWCCTVDWFG